MIPSRYVLGIVLATACGGASSPASTTTSAPPPAADDTAALRDTVAAMPLPSSCGDADTTIGAHVAEQRAALGPEVDEDTTCQPAVDGVRQCTWSVFARPSGTPDPDDPCAGECCSGYQVIFDVDAQGAIAPETIVCNAPG